MANNDRIYAAYMGEMGEVFKRQTRERIDWVLQQVEGRKNILDIGCSQGIVSILCAEQGANVTGIEIQKENYDFANQLLSTKYEQIADNVKFINQDFMEYCENKQYDAIILTEVLEHLPNAEQFLQHVFDFLNENGILVITVPFGYCDHPDHVYTFYLSSFVELVQKVFFIDSVYYGGRWFGCIACKSGTPISLDKDLFAEEEKAFLQLHKEVDVKLKELTDNLAYSNQKYKESCEAYDRIKSWYSDEQQKNSELTKNYDRMKSLYDDEKSKNVALTENYDRVKAWHENDLSKLQNLQNSIENFQNKLQKSQDEIQDLQNKLQQQHTEIQDLNDKIQTQQSKIKEQREAYERLKQWRLNDQQKLIDVIKAEHQQVLVMQKAKKIIKKQQFEIQVLHAENDSYKRKMSIINDTWYGKLALRCYNMLKKARRRLARM